MQYLLITTINAHYLQIRKRKHYTQAVNTTALTTILGVAAVLCEHRDSSICGVWRKEIA